MNKWESTIIARCSSCSSKNQIKYRNIRQNINKNGRYICRSCSNSKSNLNRSKLVVDKIVKSSKALWGDNNYRNRQLAGIKKWATMNSSKISQTMTKLWKDCEYRAKFVDGMKLKWNNTEYRAKQIDNIYKRANDIDVKRKIILSLKTNNKSSIYEDIISKLLEDLNISFERQAVIGHYSFDFYIGANNTLIEVNGDYWHSLPRAVANDKSKSTYILEYFPELKLRTVWEHEFMNENLIRNKLKEWLGFDDDKVEYDLSEVSLVIVNRDDANMFFSKYHYYSSGGRAGTDYGLKYGDVLIACARFCNPTRKEIATRLSLEYRNVLELTRFVIHPQYQKKNAASKFLSMCIKDIRINKLNIKVLVSFADPMFGHTGTIYKASGWNYDGKTSPSYFYVNGEGYVMHKKTLYNHAVKMALTECEFANKMGYNKKKSPSKHRYVYYLQ